MRICSGGSIRKLIASDQLPSERPVIKSSGEDGWRASDHTPRCHSGNVDDLFLEGRASSDVAWMPATPSRSRRNDSENVAAGPREEAYTKRASLRFLARRATKAIGTGMCPGIASGDPVGRSSGHHSR
jgi:hypothetical protein